MDSVQPPHNLLTTRAAFFLSLTTFTASAAPVSSFLLYSLALQFEPGWATDSASHVLLSVIRTLSQWGMERLLSSTWSGRVGLLTWSKRSRRKSRRCSNMILTRFDQVNNPTRPLHVDDSNLSIPHWLKVRITDNSTCDAESVAHPGSNCNASE